VVKPMKGVSPRVSGCGRWATWGCFGGIVILAFFLFSSFFTIKKGMLWTAVRGCQQVERNLPPGMEPLERARVMRNFDNLLAELRRMQEPNPVLGRFLGLVARVLEDDEVSRAEVDEINAFIETEFPETVPTPTVTAPPASPPAMVEDVAVEAPVPSPTAAARPTAASPP
jgi:hypothetical protein